MRLWRGGSEEVMKSHLPGRAARALAQKSAKTQRKSTRLFISLTLWWKSREIFSISFDKGLKKKLLFLLFRRKICFILSRRMRFALALILVALVAGAAADAPKYVYVKGEKGSAGEFLLTFPPN